jgi:hypothetical protein
MRGDQVPRLSWLILIPLLLAGAGCATNPQSDALSDQERVAQKAQQRWNLLIEGRVESAYDYLASEYRKVTPFPHYQRTVKGVGLWKSAEVREVTCESTEVCTAAVDIRVVIHYPRMKSPVETGNTVKEKWIKDGEGNWGFLPTIK